MKLINNEDSIKLDTGNEKWLNLMKMLEEVSNESTIIVTIFYLRNIYFKNKYFSLIN